MRSSNPMFSRRGFSRDNSYAGFGGPQAGPHAPQQPQAGGPYQGNPYAGGNPYAQGDLTPDQLQQMYGAPPAGPVQTGRMTIDDVVMRTAMTLGLFVASAAVAWMTVPVRNFGIAGLAAIAALGVYLVIFFRRRISPALILAYAVLEGFAVGAVSHAFNYAYDGVVAQAVLGTLAVFAGTLFAYKVGAIRVTPRYQRAGIAIAIGFVVLVSINALAAWIGGGDGLGLRSGGLGIVVGIVGILIGAFFLTLDFNEIERGVQQGAPREESWMAAFGLTLSLVWIYLELLRLLSILRD
ncbi:Bax inhibitor-1/YccA family protein [Wenjunlia tyrosinilytica]|uniref:Membrane protein n=1 Tax=Wenjunlia tyrosinilytica TaxID=1544741 RepID=A0A917ZNT9_9ACTN|nr:Bax inhibitor-1/YccA family protein [Wenjunlia tyrosinilytica]GGO88235.1 membrane protein [Wenjunlia tyrosinilytica]